MNNIEFENLLPADDFVPVCPTDKFVKNFLAHMDNDHMPKARANDNFNLLARLGALAAVFVVVMGVIYVNSDMSGLNFNNHSDKKIIAEINEPPSPEQSALEDIYYKPDQSGQDAFASQLIDYDDVTIPATDSAQKQP